MTKLLEIRDQAARFYGKYELYLFPVVKFVLAFVIFWTISAHIGYMEQVSSFAAVLVLSLVCAVLPVSAMIWLSALVVLADLYALSLEAAVTGLVLFAVIFLVYFRFSPREGIAAVITPLCFQFHIPYVMPLAAGLLREMYSVIAVVCGTIVYYFLDGIRQNEAALIAAETEEETAAASKFDISVGQILNNKEMFLVIGIFVAATAVVYLVRRLEVDHAWTLAIISGELIELAGLFVGYLLLNISGKTFWLLIGNLLSMFIAFVLEFLFMNLDYDRTERVQFEDDEYYYYVKAVPKKMVATREVKVKHFGNTSNMGKQISRAKPESDPGASSRRVIAKELDIDENLLK